MKTNEIKNKLTELKKEYGKTVFDDNKKVEPDFMFFVVGKWVSEQKELLGILKVKADVL